MRSLFSRCQIVGLPNLFLVCENFMMPISYFRSSVSFDAVTIEPMSVCVALSDLATKSR